MKLAMTVNGAPRTASVAPLKRLLDVLREDLGLTGTKEGCGEGECGACSVVIDGELVNACLVAACQVEGSAIVTVEGIASVIDAAEPHQHGAPWGAAQTRLGEKLAAVQRCFVEKGGAQCGICTPGMIVAAHCFVSTKAPATDPAVREALAGNLCRCTGYQKIVEAVQLAAAASAKGAP